MNCCLFKGEIFGLLGPNGAGKSTTIECILGTRKKDSGNINLLGQSPYKNRKNLFRKVGVQFQDSHYPDQIKVMELCQMFGVLYDNNGDIGELLDQFSLTDMVGKKVSDLSGGESQKLSVVLALINEPEIVFLDELTTGLDPKARREVWNYLKNLRDKGMTILLSSHYMDEVHFLCDRVLIMNHGKKIICGTPEDVIAGAGKESMEEAYLYYLEENKNETLIHNI